MDRKSWEQHRWNAAGVFDVKTSKYLYATFGFSWAQDAYFEDDTDLGLGSFNLQLANWMYVSYKGRTEYRRTVLDDLKSNICQRAISHKQSQVARAERTEDSCPGALGFNTKFLSHSKIFPWASASGLTLYLEKAVKEHHFSSTPETFSHFQCIGSQSFETSSAALVYKYLRTDWENARKIQLKITRSDRPGPNFVQSSIALGTTDLTYGPESSVENENRSFVNEIGTLLSGKLYVDSRILLYWDVCTPGGSPSHCGLLGRCYMIILCLPFESEGLNNRFLLYHSPHQHYREKLFWTTASLIIERGYIWVRCVEEFENNFQSVHRALWRFDVLRSFLWCSGPFEERYRVACTLYIYLAMRKRWFQITIYNSVPSNRF